MTGRLDGRKLIITGAASGMGAAIAELFAAEGASLALLDRNAVQLAAHAEKLGATALPCDVSFPEQVETAISAAAEALGGIDGIVSAAGVLKMIPFEQLEPDVFETMINVNLMGPYRIIRAALPWLKQAPAATIVNVASTSGLMPMPGTSGYSATKAGLILFTKCLAVELAPTIRANCICPGTIRTEMTRYIWESPAHLEAAQSRAALHKLGEAQDIAYAALHLTSHESAFTTGTELVVDGGFSYR